MHEVDASRGVVAAGMQVECHALTPQRQLIASGALTSSCVLDHSALAARLARGEYEAVFYVGHGYRAQGVALPQTPFLEVVHYHFGIDDPQQHFHLPFKYPPWGYSCFRGGA